MIKPLEDDCFESEILGNEAVKKWKIENNFKINDQMDMLASLDLMTDAQLEEMKNLIEANYFYF
jgi:hypothetical protein